MYNSNRSKKHIFAIVLLLSGCAALAYQVTWQRVLTQIVGSDAVSMVLVVTIFMICLGIGSELAKFLLAGSEIRALKLYIFIEAVIGAYGVLSIPLLRAANASINTDNPLMLDFIVNFLLLAPPIIGMGLTTPLIVHVAKQRISNVGRTAGNLYGWNITGAAIGSLLTGLIFIESIGLIGTTRIAAILNFLAALIASRAFLSISTSTKTIEYVKQKSASIPKNAAMAAVLFGFGTLAIQILFFRVLINYLTLSTLVFPVILCAYLCLMALGQLLGGQLADKYYDKLQLIVLALFSSGSILFFAILNFPPSWAAFLRALRFTSFNGQLIDKNYSYLVSDPSPIIIFFFSLFIMIPVVPWSALFPVMFRSITAKVEEAGDRFARVYSLYAVGNVAGAFLCGILLLPLLGTGGAATVTVLIVGCGCFILLVSQKPYIHQTSFLSWTILLLGLGASLLMPRDYYKKFKLDDYSVSEVFEGMTGVATVVPTSRFYTIIDMNRTASASAMKFDPAPSDMYQAWRWNHTELMALDHTFRPKEILVIGIGHAYLIDTMLDLPFVEKITVVDISSEVVEAVKKYTKTSSKRIFTDPRVEIIIADGRRYVQSAIKQGKRYDLIQNKINEPWHAGSSNLFTEEFFSEEKELLKPGGYLSTRPLTGHLTDGIKVFGNATWCGYYHMYFKNGNIVKAKKAIITPDIISAWFSDLPGRTSKMNNIRNNLVVTHFAEVPEQLATDPNTDDRPTFEYYWLRKIFRIWVSPRVSLSDIDLKSYSIDVPVLVSSD